MLVTDTQHARLDMQHTHAKWLMLPFLLVLHSPNALPTLDVLEVRADASTICLELAEVLELCDVREQQLPDGSCFRLH